MVRALRAQLTVAAHPQGIVSHCPVFQGTALQQLNAEILAGTGEGCRSMPRRSAGAAAVGSALGIQGDSPGPAASVPTPGLSPIALNLHHTPSLGPGGGGEGAETWRNPRHPHHPEPRVRVTAERAHKAKGFPPTQSLYGWRYIHRQHTKFNQSFI